MESGEDSAQSLTWQIHHQPTSPPQPPPPRGLEFYYAAQPFMALGRFGAGSKKAAFNWGKTVTAVTRSFHDLGSNNV